MKSACRVPIRPARFEPLTAPRGVPAAVPFDHHHSLLPLHLFIAAFAAIGCFFDQIAGAALYLSPFASSAHAVLAVLLAMATVTSRVGLRLSRDLTHLRCPAEPGLAARRLLSWRKPEQGRKIASPPERLVRRSQRDDCGSRDRPNARNGHQPTGDFVLMDSSFHRCSTTPTLTHRCRRGASTPSSSPPGG